MGWREGWASSDTSAKLYSILLGVSGGLWGAILALLVFIGKTQLGSLWEWVARVAALCALAFFLYLTVVPDYIITQWGPVPDRISSWAIAGLVSVATFVLVLMGFTFFRLLGK